MDKQSFRMEVYAETADLREMEDLHALGLVDGFVTSFSLIRAAGILDYRQFVCRMAERFENLRMAFDIVPGSLDMMEQEADCLMRLGGWPQVKIPLCNVHGESTLPLIRKLSIKGYHIQVADIFSEMQVKSVCRALCPGAVATLSVAAGSLADAGNDPKRFMRAAREACASRRGVRLMWADCREAYNIIDAEEAACDAVSLSAPMLRSVRNFGACLHGRHAEKVKAGYLEAAIAGYSVL